MTTPLYIPTIFGVSIEVYFILVILSIPTFFIWRWLLKKFIKVDTNRKIATWIATIVATPLIYVGLLILCFFIISYHPTQEFNEKKWFSDKEKRYELSRNIIDSKILIGKTKIEVRQILGNENNLDENDTWSYYLGFVPGFASIDPDILEIEF